jgi:hypothetical protein
MPRVSEALGFRDPSLGSKLAHSPGAGCGPSQDGAIGGAGQHRRPVDGLGPRSPGGHNSTGAARTSPSSLGSAQRSRCCP